MSPRAICGTVGERVRKLRLQHNLTQQQLADMTLGSLSSIRRLEARGQAPLLLLVEKAEQLATRRCAHTPRAIRPLCKP